MRTGKPKDRADGPGPKAFSRGFETLLCYVVGTYWGVYINAMGPLTPLLKADLGLSYAVAGLHYSAFAAGLLVTGFGVGSVIRRFGEAPSLLLGVFGLSLGSVVLMLGRAPGLTVAAAFAMGTLGSLAQVIVPLKLSRTHGELRAVALTELNSLSSGAAVLTPILIGLSTGAFGDWRPALAIVAALSVAMVPLLRKAGAMEPHPRTARQATAPGTAGLPPIFWSYWSCIVLTVAVEFGMISWSSAFLAATFSLDKATAALSLSLFMAAMIAGRLLGSGLGRSFRPSVLILASIAVALAGLACFLLGATLFLSFAGLFVTGLGISIQYPFLLSLAIGVAGPAAAKASATCNLASGAAILSLPFVLGGLADSFGLRDAFLVLPLVLLALLGLLAMTARKAGLR